MEQMKELRDTLVRSNYVVLAHAQEKSFLVKGYGTEMEIMKRARESWGNVKPYKVEFYEYK